MEIYCPKCAEPWDNDSLHEEVDKRHDDGETDACYNSVAREFQSKGCAALTFAADNCLGDNLSDAQKTRAQLAAVAYEMLGDDMDGAASMLDDYFWAHKL